MNRQRSFKNIALIGFMGTGKSSVGRLVASHLRFDFLDTDTVIEARTGLSVPDIFKQAGEPVFRDLERQLVEELKGREKTVISAGGGLAANDANMASLKEHALVVCLWATPQVIWERVRHQSHRPLLQSADPLETIRKLLSEREPFYKQADVLLNSERRALKEVAQHVLHQYQGLRTGARRSD